MPTQKTILQFVNQTETIVNYSSLLRSLYGDVPKVEVWYYMIDRFVVAGVFTDIRLIPLTTGYEDFSAPTHPGGPPVPPPVIKQIKVNHGGSATGIIKLG